MRFHFHAPLVCVMHCIICFIQRSEFHSPPQTTPIYFSHPGTESPYAFFTSFSASTPHSLSIEQHVCTVTSHLVPHVPFASFPFPHKQTQLCSPAYLPALGMFLTFGSAISEVQSIVLPGLTDLCCFVDRI